MKPKVNKQIELPIEPSNFDQDPIDFSFPKTRGTSDLPVYGDNPTRWHRPVEQVSWYQAKEFCDRLSKLTKRTYRLPTEAEWEYACRGISDFASESTNEQLRIKQWNEQYYQPFHFGETITSDLANYNSNYFYQEELKGIYREETTPVGMFPPNAFGLYDMHGNIWEWCEDKWHGDYEQAPTDGSAWVDKSNKSNTIVVRGGSWYYYPYMCRSGIRGDVTHDPSNFIIGFRVMCDITVNSNQ